MDTLAELVKTYLIPGSVSFLILGVAVGVGLIYLGRRARLVGRRWLTALVALYWVMSTPWGAAGLVRALDRGYGSLDTAEAVEGVEAVVVLGGGSVTLQARGMALDVLGTSSAFRVLEAARVYTLLGEPWVIVSGGVSQSARQSNPESLALREALVRAGVPRDRIVLESASASTFEHALNLAPILEARGIDRFVLITSPTHMWRALATFKAKGMDPIPSVSGLRLEALKGAGSPFLPSSEALDVSRMAMREVMALLYYWGRGWLGSP